MNTLNTLNIILGLQLTMGLPEIIICELGALILGFTIHFFWNSKKSLRIDEPSQSAGISEDDNWKLKYYNDMDMQERSQQQLRERLSQAQENEQILTIELEEKRKELEDVQHELDIVRAQLEEVEIKLAPDELPAENEEEAVTVTAAAGKLNDYTNDYLSQLKAAQEKLVEHNNSIYRLLDQTRLVEDSERRNQDLLRQNEALNEQIHSHTQMLVEKETEISNLRHQQKLSEEMTQRLDKVYDEYNTLQEKLQKLQSYLTQPHNRGTDYDGLKEAYFKLGKEHDEMKLKYISIREENQRLTRILGDTEEKLKEANFQRLQYQKRSAFLEELNHDLQEIAEHNKKIESQLRRVTDMENLLAKITGATGTPDDVQ
jgi:DNA repair exonuclease SbcCD ATPase subunit